jgi:hypothetical protein
VQPAHLIYGVESSSYSGPPFPGYVPPRPRTMAELAGDIERRAVLAARRMIDDEVRVLVEEIMRLRAQFEAHAAEPSHSRTSRGAG